MAGASVSRCFSVRQLAKYWQCSPARVRRLIRRGVVQAFLVGRAARISPEAVREAERMLAAPVSGRRRTQRRHDDISREILDLLDSET
jgi:excisionase family DNA binding protein